MDGKPSVPRYAWFVVALLWVVATFNYFDRLMIPSVRGRRSLPRRPDAAPRKAEGRMK